MRRRRWSFDYDVEGMLWLRVARASALVEAGRAGEALQLTEPSGEPPGSEPDASGAMPWLMIIRARGLHDLGRRDEELELRRRLLDDDSGSGELRPGLAYASYVLGLELGERPRLEQAAEVYAELAADPYEGGRWNRFYDGLVRLALGEEGGAGSIAEVLESFRAAGDLDEVADELARLQPKAPDPVRPAIEELRRAAVQRRATARVLTRREELSDRLDDPRTRAGARMALARLAREEHDWTAAVDAAEELHAGLPPATWGALAQATAGSAYDDAYEHGHEGALAELERSARLAARAGVPELQGDILCVLVVLRLREGEPEAAQQALDAALEGFASTGADAAAEAWNRLGTIAADAPELWALDALRWPRDRGGEQWLHVADRLEPLTDGPMQEPPHDPRPVVRLGEALIPRHTGPEWSLFSTHMPAMRERVHGATGIAAPGARFRGADDLTPSEYAIVLAGLQARRGIVGGTPSPDAREPIELVIEALEEVVSANLDQFVALDDVRDLLADAGAGSRSSAPRRCASRR